MRCVTRLGRALALTVAMLLSACAPGGVAGYGTTQDRTVILAINFDFNSHRIRPESYAALDATVAAMLSPQLAGYRFDVDGHTDIIGRFSYNVALSNLRAQAVTEYLVARGVPRSILLPQGFGPLYLLDPVNPASPVNRRVEITSIR